jgi:predicted peptidase
MIPGMIVLTMLYSLIVGSYNLSDMQLRNQSASRTIHEEKLTLNDGSILRYTLAQPHLIQGKTYPLIIALHYGGNVTPYYSRGFVEILIEPGFESLEAIIIAPDCPGHGWTDSVSVTAVLELLSYAKDNLPVDPDKTVLTGFSMGGIGCWYFAQHYPEHFSAIVPVASVPPSGMELAIPAYVIQGERDELFPLETTKEIIQAIKEKGGEIELIVEKNLTHYQTARYNQPLSRSVNWLKKIWRKHR